MGMTSSTVNASIEPCIRESNIVRCKYLENTEINEMVDESNSGSIS